MNGETVFGMHAVETLLRLQPERVLGLHVGSREDQRVATIIGRAEETGISIVVASQKELDAMTAGGNHQGVVGKVVPAQVKNDAFLKDLVATEGSAIFLLVLDEVQDPHNLGACLRSADGAGAHAVLIPQRRSAGLTPATRKVACGAAETIPVIQVSNLARSLKWLAGQGVRLVGLAGEATTQVYDQDLSGPLAIVLGGEQNGLRRLTREHCDMLVSLPMQGMIESLNVSVAAGICLYEACRQRSRTG